MNADVLKKMKFTVGPALMVNAPEGMLTAAMRSEDWSSEVGASFPLPVESEAWLS